MYFSDDFIEQVRENSDIVDVISEYVHLERNGSGYRGLCPFHNDHTPSFSVSPRLQLFNCFSCHKKGSVFKFIMEIDNLDYGQAIEFLAKRAGMELPSRVKKANLKYKTNMQLYDINREAAKFYVNNLRQDKNNPGLKYFLDRGLSIKTMNSFGLGYAPKGSNLLYNHLKEMGYSDDILNKTGLFVFDEKTGFRDKFWNRVIFPIINKNKKVIGFGGRVLGDGKPKYLNSPETDIFHKKDNLYSINIAGCVYPKDKNRPLMLCEGYMDVIAINQGGFSNAVASLGTALTKEQVSLISTITNKVLLIYDSDEAGVNATTRAIELLNAQSLKSSIVNLEPYKDPDEFIKALGPEEFSNRLRNAEDSFYFNINLFHKKMNPKEARDIDEFFNICAKELINYRIKYKFDNLTIDIYKKEIVRKYESLGINLNLLNERIQKLAPDAKEEIVKEEITIEKQKEREREKEFRKDTKGIKAERVLLSLLINKPNTVEVIKKHLSQEEYLTEIGREISDLVYNSDRELKAVSLLDHFILEKYENDVGELIAYGEDLDDKEVNKILLQALIALKEENLQKIPKNDLNNFFSKSKELKELRDKKSLL